MSVEDRIIELGGKLSSNSSNNKSNSNLSNVEKRILELGGKVKSSTPTTNTDTKVDNVDPLDIGASQNNVVAAEEPAAESTSDNNHLRDQIGNGTDENKTNLDKELENQGVTSTPTPTPTATPTPNKEEKEKEKKSKYTKEPSGAKYLHLRGNTDLPIPDNRIKTLQWGESAYQTDNPSAGNFDYWKTISNSITDNKVTTELSAWMDQFEKGTDEYNYAYAVANNYAEQYMRSALSQLGMNVGTYMAAPSAQKTVNNMIDRLWSGISDYAAIQRSGLIPITYYGNYIDKNGELIGEQYVAGYDTQINYDEYGKQVTNAHNSNGFRTLNETYKARDTEAKYLESQLHDQANYIEAVEIPEAEIELQKCKEEQKRASYSTPDVFNAAVEKTKEAEDRLMSLQTELQELNDAILVSKSNPVSSKLAEVDYNAKKQRENEAYLAAAYDVIDGITSSDEYKKAREIANAAGHTSIVMNKAVQGQEYNNKLIQIKNTPEMLKTAKKGMADQGSGNTLGRVEGNKISYAKRNAEFIHNMTLDTQQDRYYEHLRNLEYASNDEYMLYSYILESEGEEAAEKYLDYLRPILDDRAGKILNDQIQSGNMTFPAEVLMSLYGGIKGGWTNLEQIFSKEQLRNSTAEAATPYMLQSEVDRGRKFAQYGIQAAQSLGNMAPQLVAGALTGGASAVTGAASALTIGNIAGNVIGGFTSMGGTKRSMLAQGYTLDQANSVGMVVGLAESIVGTILGGTPGAGGILTGELIEKAGEKAAEGATTACAKALIKFGTTILGNDIGEISEELTQNVIEHLAMNYFTGSNEKLIDSQEAWDTIVVTALMTTVSNLPGANIDAVSTISGLDNIDISKENALAMINNTPNLTEQQKETLSSFLVTKDKDGKTKVVAKEQPKAFAPEVRINEKPPKIEDAIADYAKSGATNPLINAKTTASNEKNTVGLTKEQKEDLLNKAGKGRPDKVKLEGFEGTSQELDTQADSNYSSALKKFDRYSPAVKEDARELFHEYRDELDSLDIGDSLWTKEYSDEQITATCTYKTENGITLEYRDANGNVLATDYIPNGFIPVDSKLYDFFQYSNGEYWNDYDNVSDYFTGRKFNRDNYTNRDLTVREREEARTKEATEKENAEKENAKKETEKETTKEVSALTKNVTTPKKKENFFSKLFKNKSKNDKDILYAVKHEALSPYDSEVGDVVFNKKSDVVCTIIDINEDNNIFTVKLKDGRTVVYNTANDSFDIKGEKVNETSNQGEIRHGKIYESKNRPGESSGQAVRESPSGVRQESVHEESDVEDSSEDAGGRQGNSKRTAGTDAVDRVRQSFKNETKEKTEGTTTKQKVDNASNDEIDKSLEKVSGKEKVNIVKDAIKSSGINDDISAAIFTDDNADEETIAYNILQCVADEDGIEEIANIIEEVETDFTEEQSFQYAESIYNSIRQQLQDNGYISKDQFDIIDEAYSSAIEEDIPLYPAGAEPRYYEDDEKDSDIWEDENNYYQALNNKFIKGENDYKLDIDSGVDFDNGVSVYKNDEKGIINLVDKDGYKIDTFDSKDLYDAIEVARNYTKNGNESSAYMTEVISLNDDINGKDIKFVDGVLTIDTPDFSRAKIKGRSVAAEMAGVNFKGYRAAGMSKNIIQIQVYKDGKVPSRVQFYNKSLHNKFDKIMENGIVRDGKKFYFLTQTSSDVKKATLEFVSEEIYDKLKYAMYGNLTEEELGEVVVPKEQAYGGFLFSPSRQDVDIKMKEVLPMADINVVMGNDARTFVRTNGKDYTLLLPEEGGDRIEAYIDENGKRIDKVSVNRNGRNVNTKISNLTDAEYKTFIDKLMDRYKIGKSFVVMGEMWHNVTDGAGFVLPDAAPDRLGFQARATVGGFKGRFATVDFIKLFEDTCKFGDEYVCRDKYGKVTHGVRYIDKNKGVEVMNVYGDYVPIKNYKAIAFSSMVKNWEAYGSTENYLKKIGEENIRNINRANVYGNRPQHEVVEGFKQAGFMQMFRGTDVTEEELERILAPTMQEVTEKILKEPKVAAKVLGIDYDAWTEPVNATIEVKEIWARGRDNLEKSLNMPRIQTAIKNKILHMYDQAKGSKLFVPNTEFFSGYVSPDVIGIFNALTSVREQSVTNSKLSNEDIGFNIGGYTGLGKNEIHISGKNDYTPNGMNTGKASMFRFPIGASSNKVALVENVQNEAYEVMHEKYGVERDVIFTALNDASMEIMDGDYDGDTVYVNTGAIKDPYYRMKNEGKIRPWDQFYHGKVGKEYLTAETKKAAIINSWQGVNIGGIDIALDKLIAFPDKEIVNYLRATDPEFSSKYDEIVSRGDYKTKINELTEKIAELKAERTLHVIQYSNTGKELKEKINILGNSSPSDADILLSYFEESGLLDENHQITKEEIADILTNLFEKRLDEYNLLKTKDERINFNNYYNKIFKNVTSLLGNFDKLNNFEFKENYYDIKDYSEQLSKLDDGLPIELRKFTDGFRNELIQILDVAYPLNIDVAKTGLASPEYSALVNDVFQKIRDIAAANGYSIDPNNAYSSNKMIPIFYEEAAKEGKRDQFDAALANENDETKKDKLIIKGGPRLASKIAEADKIFDKAKENMKSLLYSKEDLNEDLSKYSFISPDSDVYLSMPEDITKTMKSLYKRIVGMNVSVIPGETRSQHTARVRAAKKQIMHDLRLALFGDGEYSKYQFQSFMANTVGRGAFEKHPFAMFYSDTNEQWSEAMTIVGKRFNITEEYAAMAGNLAKINSISNKLNELIHKNPENLTNLKSEIDRIRDVLININTFSKDISNNIESGQIEEAYNDLLHEIESLISLKNYIDLSTVGLDKKSFAEMVNEINDVLIELQKSMRSINKNKASLDRIVRKLQGKLNLTEDYANSLRFQADIPSGLEERFDPTDENSVQSVLERFIKNASTSKSGNVHEDTFPKYYNINDTTNEARVTADYKETVKEDTKTEKEDTDDDEPDPPPNGGGGGTPKSESSTEKSDSEPKVNPFVKIRNSKQATGNNYERVSKSSERIRSEKGNAKSLSSNTKIGEDFDSLYDDVANLDSDVEISIDNIGKRMGKIRDNGLNTFAEADSALDTAYKNLKTALNNLKSENSESNQSIMADAIVNFQSSFRAEVSSHEKAVNILNRVKTYYDGISKPITWEQHRNGVKRPKAYKLSVNPGQLSITNLIREAGMWNAADPENGLYKIADTLDSSIFEQIIKNGTVINGLNEIFDQYRKDYAKQYFSGNTTVKLSTPITDDNGTVYKEIPENLAATIVAYAEEYRKASDSKTKDIKIRFKDGEHIFKKQDIIAIADDILGNINEDNIINEIVKYAEEFRSLFTERDENAFYELTGLSYDTTRFPIHFERKDRKPDDKSTNNISKRFKIDTVYDTSIKGDKSVERSDPTYLMVYPLEKILLQFSKAAPQYQIVNAVKELRIMMNNEGFFGNNLSQLVKDTFGEKHLDALKRGIDDIQKFTNDDKDYSKSWLRKVHSNYYLFGNIPSALKAFSSHPLIMAMDMKKYDKAKYGMPNNYKRINEWDLFAGSITGLGNAIFNHKVVDDAKKVGAYLYRKSTGYDPTISSVYSEKDINNMRDFVKNNTLVKGIGNLYGAMDSLEEIYGHYCGVIYYNVCIKNGMDYNKPGTKVLMNDMFNECLTKYAPTNFWSNRTDWSRHQNDPVKYAATFLHNAIDQQYNEQLRLKMEAKSLGTKEARSKYLRFGRARLLQSVGISTIQTLFRMISDFLVKGGKFFDDDEDGKLEVNRNQIAYEMISNTISNQFGLRYFSNPFIDLLTGSAATFIANPLLRKIGSKEVTPYYTDFGDTPLDLINNLYQSGLTMFEAIGSGKHCTDEITSFLANAAPFLTIGYVSPKSFNKYFSDLSLHLKNVKGIDTMGAKTIHDFYDKLNDLTESPEYKLVMLENRSNMSEDELETYKESVSKLVDDIISLNYKEEEWADKNATDKRDAKINTLERIISENYYEGRFKDETSIRNMLATYNVPYMEQDEFINNLRVYDQNVTDNEGNVLKFNEFKKAYIRDNISATENQIKDIMKNQLGWENDKITSELNLWNFLHDYRDFSTKSTREFAVKINEGYVVDGEELTWKKAAEIYSKYFDVSVEDARAIMGTEKYNSDNDINRMTFDGLQKDFFNERVKPDGTKVDEQYIYDTYRNYIYTTTADATPEEIAEADAKARLMANTFVYTKEIKENYAAIKEAYDKANTIIQERINNGYKGKNNSFNLISFDEEPDLSKNTNYGKTVQKYNDLVSSLENIEGLTLTDFIIFKELDDSDYIGNIYNSNGKISSERKDGLIDYVNTNFTNLSKQDKLKVILSIQDYATSTQKEILKKLN